MYIIVVTEEKKWLAPFCRNERGFLSKFGDEVTPWSGSASYTS